MSFVSGRNISRNVSCSDARFTHLEIFTPLPSFGATVFGVYFLPIIILFGTAGNIISLIILSRAAKKISSHFYLWWMAVFDIISLLSYIPSFWAVILLRPYYYYTKGPQYPATWVEYGLLGRYVCQIRMFFTFTARTCSVYTIVLVTLERFIMVLFPLKSASFCNLFSAKISVIIMVILSVLINIPWFFAFNLFEKPCFPAGVCVGNTILMINRMVEFTILCLIPCLIIVICNGSIIYTLHGRMKLSILVNDRTNEKQERDITIRLLAVSFAFFFLTIPSLVVVSIHTAKELKNNKSYLRGPEADAFALSIVLFAVNLAINFIIYCLTGKNFRTAALAIVKCNWKDMRKYRAYLVTESTTAEDNDGMKMMKTVDRGIFRGDSAEGLSNSDYKDYKKKGNATKPIV